MSTPPPTGPTPVAPAASAIPAAAAAAASVVPSAAAQPKPPPLIPYTGMPDFSRLPKKLPHRNWFIFAAVVSIPTYAWWADREEAKKVKESYLEQVRFLSQKSMGSLDTVRTASVYCSRFPGEDGGFANDWFKKYLKPYLVAAAIDYNMPPLHQYTSLTTLLAEKYHLLRQAAGDPSSVPPPIPGKLSPQDERRRDVEGGVILVGRQSWKEYMEGLRRGWFEDRDDLELGTFEGKLDQRVFEDPSLPPLAEGETRPPPEVKQAPLNLFPLTQPPPKPTAPEPKVFEPLPAPPTPLPPLPPVLLVPYTPNLGFTSIPRSIWGFFNQTAHTRLAGEAALAFILATPSSSLTAPDREAETFVPTLEETREEGQGGWLDWTKDDEYYIPKSFNKLPKEVDERMEKYYKALEKKVATAWEIQNRTRELTESEQTNPPSTIAQLKEERFKKERRAHQDREGFRLLRQASGLAWDPRLEDSFGIWEWKNPNE